MKDHRFITFERILKNGVVNFGRNIWLAIAAIAMMMITLTILLFAIVANATFNHTVSDLTSHINVSAYLSDDITPDQRDQLISQIKKLDSVKDVQYKNKEQALKEYEAQNVTDVSFLTAISEVGNVLPASINIWPVDPNNMQPIKNFLDKPSVSKYIVKTSYSGERKAAIDNITRATHFFQQAGIAGIIIFMIISILIIFNTIRMAIFNRRDELVIMRLLGASTSYIRGPFVVETMLYGAIAAAVSILICAAIFKIASSTLQANSLGLLDIRYSDSYFSSHLLSILTLQIVAGILIGAASSAYATRRYLRVNR